MSRLITSLLQFFDNDGEPLNGGKLKFTESGSSTTLKDTYSDLAESSANANPYILSSAGRVSTDIFGSGSYRVTLFTSGDVQLAQFDPVGNLSTGQFEDFNELTTYSINDVAEGSDGNFYISIANSNIGNDPTSDATKWTKIDIIKFWNTNEEYSQYDLVRDSDGFIYVSQTNSNSANTPSTSAANWQRSEATDNLTKTTDYTITAANCRARNIVIDNTGASGAVAHDLPAAVVGYKIGFYIDAAQYLRVNANGTEIFATVNQTGAAGGYVRNNTAGLFWRIECFETGRWTLTELNDVLLYDE